MTDQNKTEAQTAAEAGDAELALEAYGTAVGLLPLLAISRAMALHALRTVQGDVPPATEAGAAPAGAPP